MDAETAKELTKKGQLKIKKHNRYLADKYSKKYFDDIRHHTKCIETRIKRSAEEGFSSCSYHLRPVIDGYGQDVLDIFAIILSKKLKEKKFEVSCRHDNGPNVILDIRW